MGFHSSWYMIEIASSLRRGERRVVERFSRKLEIERTPDGRVHVADGEGEGFRVEEAGDMILVWVGEDEPDFSVGPFAELRDPAWAPVRWHRHRPIASTVLNVMRDVADNAHFGPVHGLLGATTQLAPDGPMLRVQHEGRIDLRRFGGPPLRGRLRLQGGLHGLGLLAYRTTLDLAGIRIRNLVLSAATPIDEQRVQMFAGVTIRRWPLLSGLVQGRMSESLVADYERDAVHWESTGRYEPPTTTAEERALYGVYEAWAETFVEV